ncbi:SDR family NAD(P)-dependent oxidoreductase [Arsukibacterium indicum]|uniref:SDR family NAD(P)-dependent oxidoreductase n=1 Tax=Arsukibacterium indicum TaxID=2848612 RepID=A0ABS6MJ43_9GAMM|nr:SDR family NAD(P)-dependent oxidoreductase [Arsukibacterium indicum]MBV2128836.1 SDR family NAD(P)-dependent oxidoreductase [Arsukibacterium indicum]
MSEQVLIIGAGSGIGLGLVQHYLALGHQVQAISRSSCPAALAQPALNWLQLATTAAGDVAESMVNQAVAEAITLQPSIIFICQGWLHDNQHGPEKTLRQLTADQMQKSFAINVWQPAMYLKALFGYLTKQPDVKILVLSAKVGSITDNELGGWYSYRAGKAAVNMLVKTTGIELGRYNKTATLVSLHPGTTDTALSAPFQANVPAGQLQSAAATADRLAEVAAKLTPQLSGKLLNWDGTILPF